MYSALVSSTNALPAASVAMAVTALLPLMFNESVPLVGVALPVSTDQVPPVAVVV